MSTFELENVKDQRGPVNNVPAATRVNKELGLNSTVCSGGEKLSGVLGRKINATLATVGSLTFL